MKTIIISAFPGMGKSYTANHLSQYKMFDLESSNYSWIEIDNKKIRNPVFPQNYIKTIKNLIFQNLYQIIFISSHKIVFLKYWGAKIDILEKKKLHKQQLLEKS